MPQQFMHLDAAQSAFFQRELLAVQKRVYEQPFGPLLADELIPANTSIDPGAEFYAYDKITQAGMAQWLASGATDLPRVAVSKIRVVVPLKSYGASYGWTVQEIRAAKYAGLPLSDRLARTARRVIDTFRNTKHLLGDTSLGWSSFINDASVPVGNAVNGLWQNAATTGDKILQDINQALTDIRTTTKRAYQADTIVVPPNAYTKLTTTARGASTDTTIWQYFQKNFVGDVQPKLVMLEDLAGIGAGGTDRMIVYKRDPEVLEAAVPIVYSEEPPDQDGFQIVISCEGRIGPTVWLVPIAAKYIDGL